MKFGEGGEFVIYLSIKEKRFTRRRSKSVVNNRIYQPTRSWREKKINQAVAFNPWRVRRRPGSVSPAQGATWLLGSSSSCSPRAISCTAPSETSVSSLLLACLRSLFIGFFIVLNAWKLGRKCCNRGREDCPLEEVGGGIPESAAVQG